MKHAELRSIIHNVADSLASGIGLLIGHYERGGDIKIGDTAFDAPSDREIARRERMKREN